MKFPYPFAKHRRIATAVVAGIELTTAATVASFDKTLVYVINHINAPYIGNQSVKFIAAEVSRVMAGAIELHDMTLSLDGVIFALIAPDQTRK